MTRVTVNVHLKSEILDPQGRAILDALLKQGLNEIVEVRQGKQFVLSFDNQISSQVLEKIKSLTQNLLSNPVIEDYSIEVKSES